MEVFARVEKKGSKFCKELQMQLATGTVAVGTLDGKVSGARKGQRFFRIPWMEQGTKLLFPVRVILDKSSNGLVPGSWGPRLGPGSCQFPEEAVARCSRH